MEKYDLIGQGYNRTRQADSYLVQRMEHHLQPGPGKQFLDVGCGTGNYTIALSQKGLKFSGVDPSEKMLATARAKSNQIDWHLGRVEALPFEDAAFEGVLASLTTHHWSDLGKGFNEVYRVLKPGNKLVIFTSNPHQMEGYWLNHYFPKMLRASIAQMPVLELVQKHLQKAGFCRVITEKYDVQPDLQDLFLYSGKHDPKLYFDAQVRQGISSFSDLANADEVAMGLQALKQDIETRKVEEVIRRYEHDRGDYLFMVCEKP